jgi:tRNA(Ile2) C34 agmatinyltransferase TiaS
MTKLCRECNNPIISKAANAFLCDSCVQIHKENSISLYRKNNKSYNDEYNSQWRAANPEKIEKVYLS